MLTLEANIPPNGLRGHRGRLPLPTPSGFGLNDTTATWVAMADYWVRASALMFYEIKA